MTKELQLGTYLTSIPRKQKMSNRSKKIRLDTEELALILQHSAKFGLDKSSLSLEILSPFPLYLGTLVRTATSVRFGVKQIGWRGLILNQGKPTALAEFAIVSGREKSVCTAVRGTDAAEALGRALAIADQLQAEPDSDFSDLRFITFPGLDVTALWMFGKKPIFIPTRRGSSSRGEITALHDRTALLNLLKQEYGKRHRSDVLHSLSLNERGIGAEINNAPHILRA